MQEQKDSIRLTNNYPVLSISYPVNKHSIPSLKFSSIFAFITLVKTNIYSLELKFILKIYRSIYIIKAV